MKRFTRTPAFPIIVTMVAIAATGCMVVADGPPPGPADGYVYYYQEVGVELVYVASLGVYRVVGYPGCYYHDGRFYRDRGGHWEVASSWKGGKWKKAHPHGMPPGLARQS